MIQDLESCLIEIVQQELLGQPVPLASQMIQYQGANRITGIVNEGERPLEEIVSTGQQLSDCLPAHPFGGMLNHLEKKLRGSFALEVSKYNDKLFRHEFFWLIEQLFKWAQVPSCKDRDDLH